MIKLIRLIAMDMDGTLLDSDQRLRPESVAALKAAAASGVKLAICSGRAPGDNALFALENGLEDCAILSLNGTYCMETPTASPFANHFMDPATVRQCLAWFREADVTFAAYLQNRVGLFYSTRQQDPIIWGSHREQPGAPVYTCDWDAFEKMLPDGVNKLLCLEPEDSVLLPLDRKLATLPLLERTSSWPQNRELMPRGIGKGSAVKELAARLAIPMEQVMTLGDYDNDLSMIQCAGLGVAMGNATEAVKAVAGYVTRTNDENGVAYAIRRFVLAQQ